MKQFHSLKVAAKTREARDAVRITLEVPDELREEFAFLPGQHLPIQVERGGKRLPLTAKELGLLQLLYSRRGSAMSRGEILQEVWDLHPDTRTRVVDTFIVRLRKLIDMPEGARGACFDRLRKEYPQRREFRNTMVTAARKSAAETLAAMGFKV